MPEGPLGVPRPASKAPIRLTLRFDEPITSKDTFGVESALNSAAQSEIGGPVHTATDTGKLGNTAIVETTREQVFLEEVNSFVDEFNSLSPVEMDAISIDST